MYYKTMVGFIVFIIIFLAYTLIDFLLEIPGDAAERRKEDEKYSLKNLNKIINNKQMNHDE